MKEQHPAFAKIAGGPEQGLKFDEEKVRLDLVPPELMLAVGEILTFGAKKYGDRNWENGIKFGRVYGALLRHLNAWWAGTNLDHETGKSHLWHAACCLSFLITYEARGMVAFDDRANVRKDLASALGNLGAQLKDLDVPASGPSPDPVESPPEDTWPRVLKVCPTAKREDWDQHPHGMGWVRNTASVDAESYVAPDAVVSGAVVVKKSSIYDNAHVLDRACVTNSQIKDATVKGSCGIFHSTIMGDSSVSGNATVFGSTICGSSHVWGDAKIVESTVMNCRIHSNTRVFQCALVDRTLGATDTVANTQDQAKK